MPVLSAASLRLACGHPVRRFVASSGETAGVDEGLGQGHTRPVAPEPIARQTPQAGAEDVAGPMRHLNPRQDEEPRVAAHHLQVALPRGGVPPDPLAAGLAFPSGRSKEQASEGTAIMSSDEILHVLADRPIEAKVVTSSHEMVERRLIPRKAAGIHDAHWLYLRDPAADGRPVHFHDRHCRRATRASSPPGGKFDQRARFQLAEQFAAGHVFILAIGAPPIPTAAKLAREGGAVPSGILKEKPVDRAHVRLAYQASLYSQWPFHSPVQYRRTADEFS